MSDSNEKLVIPFDLIGVMSSFTVRKPTWDKIRDIDPMNRIQMTNQSPEWSPNDSTEDVDESKLRVDLGNDSIREKEPRTLHQRMARMVRVNTRAIADIRHRRKGTIDPITLSSRWGIGIPTAEKTCAATTQLGVRDFSDSVGSKRLKHTAYQLKHRRLRADVYTDTLFSDTKSLAQNTCGQIYATDFGWVQFYPMMRKKDAHATLERAFNDFGIFNNVIPDNAPELTSGQLRKTAHKFGCRIRPIEAWTPNQNLAEANIRELKRMYRREMKRTNCPAVLWDHCLELMAKRWSHTVLTSSPLMEGPPMKILTGDTPDISHLVEHRWYDPVWYSNPRFEGRKLGRWLGPSDSVGQAMSSKILTAKGKIVHRTSVWPLSVEKSHDETFTAQKEQFNDSLREALGNRADGLPPGDEDEPDEYNTATPHYEAYEDDEQGDVRKPDMDEHKVDSHDKLISAKVMLPLGDSLRSGQVKRRKRDSEGNLVGRASSNPFLDTSMYEVEFQDGHVESYAANLIAENIYEQLDDEGNKYCLIDQIIDHKKDASAIPLSNGTIMLNGREHKKRTTRGWSFCVQWRDGTTSWENLKDLKESNPLEVAEYAVANLLDKEPAFAWWVNFALKRRDRLIKAAKTTRYMRKWQKYGIEIPKTVERALEIDKETGTDFWAKALRLEKSKIFPAVKILDEGAQHPVGHQMIPYHIVFDVKMDFTRKARFVAGGHKTQEPETPTYACVVSRESVRIGFLLAALNDIEVIAANIAGAYLNAPCHEKICFKCGLEFGKEYEGRFAIITKALYGLKTSAFAWREHLSTTLQESLGFSPCRADPDVYLRAATKLDGTRYYEMVFIYIDDVLVQSNQGKEILNMLDQHYLLKLDSIGPPKLYLRNQVETFDIDGDTSKRCWALSSRRYAKEAIRNVQNWMESRGMQFKTRTAGVLPANYRPELDTSAYCDHDWMNFFQQQMGVLRCLVEFGRIDITAEVSMLAAFLAGPREGHVHAMLHIFAYINTHDRSRLVLDPSYITHGEEPNADWNSFYPDAKEEIPPDCPEPLGKSVQMTAFVDSDHAGDLVTRRSRTGILIFLNRAPVNWYSKKQTSVETSTFGSEFMALKVGIEMIKGLRYKLRMMGVPLEGHTHVRVDNMSVVQNSSKPSSTLRKKSNAIAYHFVRENVANGTYRIAYEPSRTNLADLLTKIQSGSERTRLASLILY